MNQMISNRSLKYRKDSRLKGIILLTGRKIDKRKCIIGLLTRRGTLDVFMRRGSNFSARLQCAVVCRPL